MGATEIVTAYGESWNQSDESGRRKLLEEAWADDGIYSDPTALVEGREALIAHIGGFHEAFPGARIDATTGVDEHHGWLRFGWVMRDATGATVTEGFDVGELADDGRLRRIVGFFGPFPPGP